MSEMKTKRMASVGSVFRLYSARVLQHRFYFAGAVFATVAIQILALVGPLYLRGFFNVLVAGTPTPALLHQLYLIVAALSAVWILNWAMNRIQYLALMHLEVSIMTNLYSEAFEYLIRHSYHFFISNFAGSLTHKVSKFSRSFETLFDSIFSDFFPTAIFVSGAVFILFLHNKTIGIALGIWVILFTAFQVYVARLRQPSRVLRSEADTRVTAVLADSISNHTTITLFSGASFEDSLLRSTLAIWQKLVLRTWIIDNNIWTALGIFIVAIEIGLMYAAIVFWGRGQLTVGDFVLIQSYLLSTFTSLTSINRTLRRFYDGLADAQEMVAILEEPHEIQDKPDAPRLVVTDAAIGFKNVGFHFNTERPILEGFDLLVRAGEKIALVGPSGAGKSTITKLLLRFYDLNEGHISIDGQDIASVTQESLREQISFVPQEPVLFHRTLIENIRYGRRGASDEEVFEAARKAHCHEFIAGLSQGYETLVGERGIRLSGGERQRIAIARALLKDAPILVLDEATSSLDSESESLIQDSLKILMQGKTVLVIAHRLSTIMNMDRIVVLQGGKVVDQGTHQELLENDGLYQKLWNIQAGGFIQDEESLLQPESIPESVPEPLSLE